MEQRSLVQRYALAPDAIETLSRERLAAHLRLPPDLSPDQAEIVTRIVYATGDPTIAPAVPASTARGWTRTAGAMVGSPVA